MIKYTICPEHPAFDEETFRSKEECIKDMFSVIAKNEMENKMNSLNVGQCLIISSGSFDGDVEITNYFRCTGNKKGHFTQRILEPSGLHYHFDSLEFTYE